MTDRPVGNSVRFTRIARWTGVGLLLAGLTVFMLFDLAWRRDHVGPALRAPIKLVEGVAAQWHLAPKLTDNYEIALEVRHQSGIAPDSALGSQWRVRPQGDDSSEVDIAWSVTEDGIERVRGRASGVGSIYTGRDHSGRGLGWCDLKEGHNYVLEVHVLRTASTLDTLTPTIKVDRHPSHLEGWGILALMFWSLGGALMISGGVVLLRSRRRLGSA